MARGSRQIVVQFLGDTKDFDRAVGTVQGKTSKLGGSMKKLGVAAGVGLGVGAVVAGKALIDMGKAAAEDAQSQALLAKSLKNSAKATDKQVAATEDWITAQGKALGVADDDLRPALSTLARATGDVSKAQKLASLAMDISAGTGKNLGSVSQALAKAQNGNVGGLARLGVATKDAEGKTKSFAQIQDELAKKFKGSASTAANTFQGKMGRLNLMFDEAKESIGAKLLPVAEKLANWFVREGLPAIQKFGKWFDAHIVPTLKDAAEKILPKLQDAWEGVKKAFKDAQPFLKLVADIITNVLIPGITKVAQVVIPIWIKSLGLVAKALGKIAEVGAWMWNTILQPVFKLLTEAIATALRLFGKMLSALGHVPGFGWAKTAAKHLGAAADEADELAGNISKIPSKKEIAFKATFDRNLKALMDASAGFLPLTLGVNVKGKASGGRVRAGELYKINENGMEMFRPDSSGRIIPAEQTRQTMRVGSKSGSTQKVVHVVQLMLNGRMLREIQLDSLNSGGVNVGLV